MLQHIAHTLHDRAVRHRLYGAAAGIEAAVIFALSVGPGMEGGVNSGPAAHGLAYGLLSFTLGLYCRGTGNNHPLLTGALGAAGFGALIEIIQFFIPYRTCEAQDAVINLCSALFAMIPGLMLHRKGRR